MEDLDKLLAADPEAEAQKKASEAEASAKAEEDKKQIDPEIQKREEHKANLDKAIAEGKRQLEEIRAAKKAEVKTEEEIPKIDMNDPGSKAWDKHIREQVNPLQSQIEKENEEVFNFTFKRWLSDKPALAADPDKMKEFISNYERNKTNTGRTQEGVEEDLDKAYAVTYAELLLSRERDTSRRKAEGLALFSEPGVSRGATSYFQEKPDYASKIASISDDDRAIILRMGYESVEDWAKDKEKYS